MSTNKLSLSRNEYARLKDRFLAMPDLPRQFGFSGGVHDHDSPDFKAAFDRYIAAQEHAKYSRRRQLLGADPQKDGGREVQRQCPHCQHNWTEKMDDDDDDDPFDPSHDDEDFDVDAPRTHFPVPPAQPARKSGS